jgi:hypothetical protein
MDSSSAPRATRLGWCTMHLPQSHQLAMENDILRYSKLTSRVMGILPSGLLALLVTISQNRSELVDVQNRNTDFMISHDPLQSLLTSTKNAVYWRIWGTVMKVISSTLGNCLLDSVNAEAGSAVFGNVALIARLQLPLMSRSGYREQLGTIFAS